MVNFNIFFDDGGVINDNLIRGRQWQKLVGEYFTQRYGDDPVAWGKANFEVVDSIMKYIEDEAAENGILSYERFRLYEITTMIEHWSLNYSSVLHRKLSFR